MLWNKNEETYSHFPVSEIETITDEALFWPGVDGDCGDYDDDNLVCDDMSTTVVSGGSGVLPGQGTIPSYGERRKRRTPPMRRVLPK